jgi:hypothetical protein
MDHLLYIAASGPRKRRSRRQINANNLANASTVGFKGDMLEAESVYLLGEGDETRAYNVVRQVGHDLREGMLEQTGRDLDVAINGPAGSRCRRVAAARACPGAATCASTSSASWSTAPARRCWATTDRSPCRHSAP